MLPAQAPENTEDASPDQPNQKKESGAMTLGGKLDEENCTSDKK